MDHGRVILRSVRYLLILRGTGLHTTLLLRMVIPYDSVSGGTDNFTLFTRQFLDDTLSSVPYYNVKSTWDTLGCDSMSTYG